MTNNEDVRVFESRYLKRTCEVHIDNFKKKMKTSMTGTKYEVNLFSDGCLKFTAIIYPAGVNADSKGHVSVYLRNASPVEAYVNYSFAVGNHVKMTNNRFFKNMNEQECSFGFDKFLPHDDKRIFYKFILSVTVDVVRASIAKPMDQMQVDTALGSKLEALDCKLSDIKATIQNSHQEKQPDATLGSRLEALGSKLTDLKATIQTCPQSRPLPCPECPICLDDMKPPTKIIHCKGGHLICEKCEAKPGVKFCPTCREEFNGRAVGMEKHLRQLFGHE